MMNKKDQIYEAALRLFNKHGFDKTPTSQIAKEAGVATGTLFHYFATKDELINGLYLRCKDTMLETVLQGVEDMKDYKGQIRIIYKNLLKGAVACSEEFLFFQQFSHSAVILDSTKKQGIEKFNVIYEFINRGIEDGIIKNVDIEFITQCVMGIISSSSLYLMTRPKLLEDSVFMEQAFSLVWDAIKK
jgi:AcrR family transcriptional regulator